MPRYRRPRPAGQTESSRPSLFFIIAISLGLILLVVAFIQAVRRPAPTELEETTTTTRIELRLPATPLPRALA
jgi:hypothetical protein